MGIFRKISEWPAKLNETPFIARLNKRTRWVILVGILILISASGFAYYKLVYVPSKATTTTTASLQTTPVRQGNLIIYASGNGTLTASNEASFGFGTSGQITKVNAKVGDIVKTGDVLAEIDNSTQQIQYIQAKRALAEMTSPYAIATAEQSIATALQSVDTARSSLAYLLSPAVVYWEEQVAKSCRCILGGAGCESRAGPGYGKGRRKKRPICSCR
jgi:multidrug efflux pump subunit AcrA (membrane-fusion protein)